MEFVEQSQTCPKLCIIIRFAFTNATTFKYSEIPKSVNVTIQIQQHGGKLGQIYSEANLSYFKIASSFTISGWKGLYNK
jgi:hypothetical protein